MRKSPVIRHIGVFRMYKRKFNALTEIYKDSQDVLLSCRLVASNFLNSINLIKLLNILE